MPETHAIKTDFSYRLSGTTQDKSKWLLTQFAMVEMYARMSNL